MKSKVKWGVVGSGGIARRRTIPEGFVGANNAHLVAVWGGNPATNRQVAKDFGAIAADSLESLLATELDAVYIASPVHAHLEQVLACARAGKHVLCEKPLGMDVAEADTMVKACRDAGVHFGTAFMMRFHSQHQAALKFVQEGRLGKPVFGRAQLSCWYPPIPSAWRHDPKLSGGGSLIDMGNHCIDLLEMFFGPVAKVSCFTNRTVQSYESEDSAVVLLNFANGALGTVDVFFCIQDSSSKNVLELYGAKGSILASGTIGQGSEGQMTAWLQEADIPYDSQQSRTTGGGLRLAPPARNIYRAEIESFGSTVLEGKPNELSSDLGLHSQKVIAACYESAKTGKAMEIV